MHRQSNDVLHRHIGDHQIVVFKIAAEYYALDNACTHQGGPLCDGTLDNGVIQCPWHGARFDVTPATSQARRPGGTSKNTRRGS